MLEELKKIKFRNEYEEHQNQIQQTTNFDTYQESKGFNNPNHIPNTYESNIVGLNGTNLNNLNLNNNNNCLTETGIQNNQINHTTGNKRFARLSTVQPEQIHNNIIQPINMRYRQSRVNLNNNIIKNITKRSSIVLNNMGFGLAFRRSIFDPSASSPVLCNACNNYYYANNAGTATRPFNIGINEDGNENELMINTLSNMNISATNKSLEKDHNNIISKEMDKNEKINSNKENENLPKDKIVNSKENKKSHLNRKKKFNSKMISNESIDQGTIDSVSSRNTNSNGKKALHSKNVSFFLNDKETKEISNKNNNISDNKNSENQNMIALNDLLHSKNDMIDNIKKDNILNEKRSEENESKQDNESDITLVDNISQNKINMTPLTDSKEKQNFINNVDRIVKTESNKNVNIITSFNNNFNSTNKKTMINSNNKKFDLTKRNTVQNNELSDFELTNLKSKWEALRQSVISTNSNNINLRMFKDENFSELKLAKKETILYKNCFDSITTDYKKLKSNCKNVEKILNQDLENYKNLKEVEIVKFAKALEVYNDLYSQHIKIKDIKIKQLANLIDQLVEKENYSVINNLNNSKFLIFD